MTSSTEARLLAHIRQRNGLAAIPRRGDREGPLSFAQRRLWFLDQLAPDSAQYVVPSCFRLRGPVDVDALARAFSALVERHEVLRTRFVTGADGEPRQLVDDPWTVDIGTEDVPETDVLAAAHAAAAQPFDLTSGRLLRVCLFRVADGEQVLLVLMHHIVTDGWSMGVLGRELGALYGGSVGLPDLAVQYADFAAWQREWLAGPVLERQLAYWRDQLAGLEPLTLPTDRALPAAPTTAGDGVSFTVPGDVVHGLRALANRHDTSLLMVTQATFLLTLSRWTGQDDVCVGTAVTGRDRAEIEDLIGFFVNTLVIRADLGANPTFDRFLDQVKATSLDAYAHQDLPSSGWSRSWRPPAAAATRCSRRCSRWRPPPPKD